MSIERIKFRGKIKAKKSVEMNGYTLVPNTWLTTDMISGGDHLDNVPERIHEFWHLVDEGWIDPATIGQWTGLVDSKGVEVYEGDVVYLAGYGDYEAEFPFDELYRHGAEDDIGAIIGNVHEVTT